MQNIELPKPFGWMAQLELEGCNPKIINNRQKIRRFTPRLCEVIGMKIFDKPWIRRFKHPKTGEPLIQFIQLIETSTVMGHLRLNSCIAHIDIFSCQSFDPKAAASFTQDYFGAQVVETRFIRRGNPQFLLL